jgi:hypothetical protein
LELFHPIEVRANRERIQLFRSYPSIDFHEAISLINATVGDIDMSTNNTKDYTFAESTQKLYDLALKAGEDTRAEAVAANETPVSKLTYTSRCGEITAEYYSAHHKVSRKA